MIVVQLQSLDDVIAAFRRAPALVIGELNQAIHVSALVVQRMARKEAPADRGILRNSIKISFRPLSATVAPSGASAKYAVPVHEGSKPHFPPIKALTGKEEALDLWARRHGIPAWAVARSIARKGTKANPFMQRAAEAAEGDIVAAFDVAVGNITRGVS
jgi:hypothetical protein